MKILFVCTGNICRSPTAEAVARNKAKLLGLSDQFEFDSAGIEGYHLNDNPDPRAIETAGKQSVSFEGIKARQINKQDLEHFDIIIAMDKSHQSFLLNFANNQKQRNKIKLFLEFFKVKNSWDNQVIDPYYKSSQAFDEVFQVISLALDNFFNNLSSTTN
ncbi:MAG: low molecular weight protein-tyrosine-phosphatase [Alphaproteobacteria bacterium]